ncbi:hypothetical protein C0J52_22157 [Blattella germanica]|nr:hypothetical protein C0J52_22157 [Blattella germanica]
MNTSVYSKILRKTFGPKRDEETGEWRRLHITEQMRRIFEGKQEGKRPVRTAMNLRVR